MANFLVGFDNILICALNLTPMLKIDENIINELLLFK